MFFNLLHTLFTFLATLKLSEMFKIQWVNEMNQKKANK